MRSRYIGIPSFHSVFLTCCFFNPTSVISVVIKEADSVLLLFKLKDKEKAWWGGYKTQWSAMRGFNWQNSNSYIMRKPFGLFFHTILFTKFNMLASFYLHLLANIDGGTPPHDFPLEEGQSVSHHKAWRDLFIKACYGRWGTNFLRQIYWGTVLHGRLMIRSCQGQASFTNALQIQ